MNSLPFFTSIQFDDRGKDFKHLIFESIENYFSFFGLKKVYVIPGKVHGYSQEVDTRKIKQTKREETVFLAIKVASYTTVIIPIIVLISKLFFRISYKFHLPLKKTFESSEKIRRYWKDMEEVTNLKIKKCLERERELDRIAYLKREAKLKRENELKIAEGLRREAILKVEQSRKNPFQNLRKMSRVEVENFKAYLKKRYEVYRTISTESPVGRSEEFNDEIDRVSNEISLSSQTLQSLEAAREKKIGVFKSKLGKIQVKKQKKNQTINMFCLRKKTPLKKLNKQNLKQQNLLNEEKSLINQMSLEAIGFSAKISSVISQVEELEMSMKDLDLMQGDARERERLLDEAMKYIEKQLTHMDWENLVETPPFLREHFKNRGYINELFESLDESHLSMEEKKSFCELKKRLFIFLEERHDVVKMEICPEEQMKFVMTEKEGQILSKLLSGNEDSKICTIDAIRRHLLISHTKSNQLDDHLPIEDQQFLHTVCLSENYAELICSREPSQMREVEYWNRALIVLQDPLLIYEIFLKNEESSQLAFFPFKQRVHVLNACLSIVQDSLEKKWFDSKLYDLFFFSSEFLTDRQRAYQKKVQDYGKLCERVVGSSSLISEQTSKVSYTLSQKSLQAHEASQEKIKKMMESEEMSLKLQILADSLEKAITTFDLERCILECTNLVNETVEEVIEMNRAFELHRDPLEKEFVQRQVFAEEFMEVATLLIFKMNRGEVYAKFEELSKEDNFKFLTSRMQYNLTSLIKASSAAFSDLKEAIEVDFVEI